jgi:hypothetical protein
MSEAERAELQTVSAAPNGGGVLFMRSVLELRDVTLFAKCSVALPVDEILNRASSTAHSKR